MSDMFSEAIGETEKNGKEEAEKTTGATRPLLPIGEVLDGLSKNIPQRHLKTKRKGGATLTFCPWYRTQRILDHYTNGHWEVRIIESKDIDGRYMMRIELTIYGIGRDGDITSLSRQATGNEGTDVDTFGDPSSNAESMAFRRACAKFGLGLHLWDQN